MYIIVEDNTAIDKPIKSYKFPRININTENAYKYLTVKNFKKPDNSEIEMILNKLNYTN